MIDPDDFDEDARTLDPEGNDNTDSRLSRSQKTRAAVAVKNLGIRLTKMSPVELDRLELPERLREEVGVCQRLKPRSRGRQNRLIGQLLRAEDHEAIQKRIETLHEARSEVVAREKRVEQWLARLLEEGDPAVELLLVDFPQGDRQRLRSLVRSARKTSEAKKAKRARRELLRAIRELDD